MTNMDAQASRSATLALTHMHHALNPALLWNCLFQRIKYYISEDSAHLSLSPDWNSIRTKYFYPSHTEKPSVRAGHKRKHLLEEFESFDHPTIA